MVTHTIRICITMGVASTYIVTHSATALADSTQEDTNRAIARNTGYDGIRAFQSGDVHAAADKLGRAFAVVKVPTLGLWYARALVKTGRLVEAAERYGEVVRLEVTEGKVKEQQKAQREAAAELEELQPKIPSLTVNAEGLGEDGSVTLDGKSIPPKFLGLPAPVDPGTHRVQATRGERVIEQNVALSESEKKSITLVIPPEPGPRAAATSTSPRPRDTNGTSSNPARAGSEASKGSTQKTLGWLSLGLGGAATAFGVTTGIVAMTKRSQLDDSPSCNGRDCYSSELLDGYHQMRTMSTVGFIVGVVGVATGTTLLLTTPKGEEVPLHAWLGVGSAGVGGHF